MSKATRLVPIDREQYVFDAPPRERMMALLKAVDPGDGTLTRPEFDALILLSGRIIHSIPIAPWKAPAVFPDPRVLGWAGRDAQKGQGE
jgi:hypothetical protein